MALKRLFIDIQGDLFDMWQFTSAEKGPNEYNEVLGRVEYTLIINATAKTRDLEAKTYRFDDEDERDNLLLDIKEQLMKNPNIYFLGETDGSINDDELERSGYNQAQEENKYPKKSTKKKGGVKHKNEDYDEEEFE